MLLLLFFFLFKIVRILTHTYRNKGEGLKETDSGIYSKKLNSYIHNTNFKHL